MTRRLTQTGAAILVASAVAACGSQPAPTAQIRNAFEQFVAALRDRDARAACELLFVFGEHQPPGALRTALRQSNTAAGQAKYQSEVAQCTPTLAEPSNLAVYYRSVEQISLSAIAIHGDIATARAKLPHRPAFTLRFVQAAGHWRLLEGVQ